VCSIHFAHAASTELVEDLIGSHARTLGKQHRFFDAPLKWRVTAPASEVRVFVRISAGRSIISIEAQRADQGIVIGSES
jgi:hypothetical protein